MVDLVNQSLPSSLPNPNYLPRPRTELFVFPNWGRSHIMAKFRMPPGAQNYHKQTQFQHTCIGNDLHNKWAHWSPNGEIRSRTSQCAYVIKISGFLPAIPSSQTNHKDRVLGFLLLESQWIIQTFLEHTAIDWLLQRATPRHLEFKESKSNKSRPCQHLQVLKDGKRSSHLESLLTQTLAQISQSNLKTECEEE